MSLLGLGLLGAGTGLLGMANQNQQAKKQDERSLAMSKEMAGVNYEYGEQAADNAHQRGLALLEANKQANSYGEKVKQAKEAGLSIGMLYGGGGAGGSASGSTGAQGSGASGMGAPQAAQMAGGLDVLNMMNNIKMAQAQTKKVENESKLVESQKENIDADTTQKLAQADMTPMQKELMRQTAINQFIENERKEWQQGEQGDISMSRNANLKYTTGISKNSYFDRTLSNEIAESISRTESNKALAELNTEKKEGYWQELLNATKNADSNAIQAAAIKLASEWNTGEYTNWKTWANTASDAIKAVGDLVKLKK